VFRLASEYSPRGDQPQAIAALTRFVRDGRRHVVLRGVTGSGKTYTIANVIANAGRPTLVLFAVPGFCTSRLCGPELEIMRKLYPKYKNRAEFIHVEFYERPGVPNSPVAPGVAEWGLRTEPWFFVIDAKGVIAAKFEGPTSLQELDEALQKVAP